jgi:hypothetical protein
MISPLADEQYIYYYCRVSRSVVDIVGIFVGFYWCIVRHCHCRWNESSSSLFPAKSHSLIITPIFPSIIECASDFSELSVHRCVQVISPNRLSVIERGPSVVKPAASIHPKSNRIRAAATARPPPSPCIVFIWPKNNGQSRRPPVLIVKAVQRSRYKQSSHI